LVLARNPALRWDEVKDVLRRCCDRIDPVSGLYDTTGRSKYYGHGRLNARTAVNLAADSGMPAPALGGYRAIHQAVQNVPVKDLETSTLSLEVGDSKPVQSLTVTVDVEHTYVGDLVVRLLAPGTTGVGPVTLHDRVGGSADNLKQAYTTANVPGLAAFTGTSPQGTWTLEVEDREKQDTGKINSFAVELLL
jgi:subtilisin-like proprotein convertase family protein